jgi:hypothetical protein
MNTSSNGYVLGFAVTVCVTISAMLAATATSLGPMQQEAAELDRQKNVMMAAGLLQAGETKPQAELRKLYDERIKEVVVDTESGKVLDGKAAGDADKLNKEGASAARDPAAKKKAEARYRVVAQAKGTDGKATYVLPISGKGLDRQGRHLLQARRDAWPRRRVREPRVDGQVGRQVDPRRLEEARRRHRQEGRHRPGDPRGQAAQGRRPFRRDDHVQRHHEVRQERLDGLRVLSRQRASVARVIYPAIQPENQTL